MNEKQESKRSLFRASSGEPKAEAQQSETSTADATSETQPSTAPVVETPSDSETEPKGRKELKARMEAKAAAEPERPPHPYKWRIERPSMVPFGLRSPENGEPCPERIEAHIADCWRAETVPGIAGVLVMQPKV